MRWGTAVDASCRPPVADHGRRAPVVAACGRLLTESVAAAPAAACAWHWGPTDPSGFAAMGIGELLVHGYDMARGLGIEWRPQHELAAVVVSRLIDTSPADDPTSLLLWANRSPRPPWQAACRGLGVARCRRRCFGLPLHRKQSGGTAPVLMEFERGPAASFRTAGAGAGGAHAGSFARTRGEGAGRRGVSPTHRSPAGHREPGALAVGLEEVLVPGPERALDRPSGGRPAELTGGEDAEHGGQRE